jgi:hypothetical protein
MVKIDPMHEYVFQKIIIHCWPVIEFWLGYQLGYQFGYE